jgi:DNA-directed RNA polymerase specialized sigma subunit
MKDHDGQIADNLELVRKIAQRLTQQHSDQLSNDDAVALVQRGLIEAAQHHDATSDEPFSVFAEKRICAAVLDELRGRRRPSMMKSYDDQNRRPSAERDRLIADHVEIARRISLRLARRCPDWIPREDLVPQDCSASRRPRSAMTAPATSRSSSSPRSGSAAPCSTSCAAATSCRGGFGSSRGRSA